MKKIIAISLAVAISAVCFVFSATAATNEEIINLIAPDGVYTISTGGGGTLTHTFDGTQLTIQGAGGWPALINTFEEPILVDPENTVLNIKFTISNGGATSIRLITNDGEDDICLTHFFGDDIVYDSGSGDFMSQGTFELSIPFSELECNDGNAGNNYIGFKDLILDDNGFYILESIAIYATGNAKLVIDKFELVVTTETIDVSDEPSTEEPSTEPTTPTGDSGYVAFALISLVTLAAVVVVNKNR